MSEPDDTLRDLPDDQVAVAPPSHAVLRYSALRFAILVGVGALLYLVGLRGLLLLVFAFLISGIVSIFALNRTREAAALGVTTAVANLNERIDASSRAEDDDPDDDLAEYAADPPPAAPHDPEPRHDPEAAADPEPGSTAPR